MSQLRPKMPVPTPRAPRPTGPKPRVTSPRVIVPPPRPVSKLPSVSLAQKGKAVELMGERATRNRLYYMGQDRVFRLQHDGVHGIDLGSLTYNKMRRPIAGTTNEIKTRSPHYPPPSSGVQQTSPKYVERNLLKARAAGVKGADDLYRLYKKGKVTNYFAAYSVKHKGQGVRLYEHPRDGPISKKPI